MRTWRCQSGTRVHLIGGIRAFLSELEQNCRGCADIVRSLDLAEPLGQLNVPYFDSCSGEGLVMAFIKGVAT